MGKKSVIEICSLFTKANFSRSPRKYFVFILFPPPAAWYSTHYFSIGKIHIRIRSFLIIHTCVSCFYILLSHIYVRAFVSFYFLLYSPVRLFSRGSSTKTSTHFLCPVRKFLQQYEKKFFISARNAVIFFIKMNIKKARILNFYLFKKKTVNELKIFFVWIFN